MYRLLCWLALPERPVGHTVFTGNAQNPQKVPKMGVTPPNKSNVATIVFDKFGPKALPLLGVAFIRSKKIGAKALPLLGKQRKILVYALIRSVASMRQLPLFWQKGLWSKKKMGPKMANKGCHFFLFIFCAFGAKKNGDSDRP